MMFEIFPTNIEEVVGLHEGMSGGLFGGDSAGSTTIVPQNLDVAAPFESVAVTVMLKVPVEE